LQTFFAKLALQQVLAAASPLMPQTHRIYHSIYICCVCVCVSGCVRITHTHTHTRYDI
jgi:hypothetical protein